MRKFLISLGLFTGLLLVANAALYWFGHRLYFGEYRTHSLSHGAYLLADSHGLPLGNHTERFGVFNFSAGSDSYYDMRRKVRYLIQYSRVDTIYITVDDHTLGSYRDVMNNMDRSAYYATPEEYTTYYDYFKNRYLIQYLPIFQPTTRTVIRSYIFSQAKRLLRSSVEVSKIEDLTWADHNANARDARARARAKTQFSGEVASIGLQRAFMDIIELAHAHGITLIGVRFPISRDYAKLIGEHSYGAHGLLATNDILDYRDSLSDADWLFQDQDHLTPTAGRDFAAILFAHGKLTDLCALSSSPAANAAAPPSSVASLELTPKQ